MRRTLRKVAVEGRQRGGWGRDPKGGSTEDLEDLVVADAVRDDLYRGDGVEGPDHSDDGPQQTQ